MTVSVSVLSHAFLTGRGIFGASLPSGSHDLCSNAVLQRDPLDPRAEMKPECAACGCRQIGDIDYTIAVTPRMQPAGCCVCREYSASPCSIIDMAPTPRVSTSSPSPRQMSVATPSPRTAAGRSQAKKKANKKRGSRKRGKESESKDPMPMTQVAMTPISNRGLEDVQTGACMLDMAIESSQIGARTCFGRQAIAGAFQDTQACTRCITGGNADTRMEVDVVLHDIREECSSALGIVKEDLELFGLYHVPRVSERAMLPKDKSGLVHLGVMVRNSELNLQSIEELIIGKDKAAQEAESYRLQISEKSQEFNDLKLKYDKLTQEVLRLRIMVNRANRLRRESEKATEMLRGEFDKLVQTLFMDRSSRSLEEPPLFIKEATNEISDMQTKCADAFGGPFCVLDASHNYL